jgi:hypothetical protein
MPDAGHTRLAIGTSSLARDVIRKDDISVPLDQPMITFSAKGIFILPDLTRQIPRVNVSQPGFPADLRCAQ